MKKLLAMMAAACAISAFAETADLLDGFYGFEETAIEAPDAEADFFGGDDDDGQWLGEDHGQDTKVRAYGEAEKPAVIKADEIEPGDQYLHIETDGGAVSRAFTSREDWVGGVPDQVAVGDVFVDTAVKFTAFDAAPTTIDPNAQFALWLLADEENGVTNLMINCGTLDGDGTAGTTTVALDVDVLPDTWHRVTIKPLLDSGTTAGLTCFLVYIDGKIAAAKDYLAVFDQDVIGGFLKEGKAFAQEKQLFPSLLPYGEQPHTLTSVAFQGTGDIDMLNITPDDPIPVEPTEIEFTLPELENATITADPVSPVAPGTEVTFTVKPAAGYLFADGTSEKTFKLTIAEAGEIQIPDGVDVTTKAAEAQIGTTLYLTLKAAVDAAEDNQEVKLLANCTGDGIMINKSITIDFCSFTYTVDASLVGSPNTKSQAFNLVNGKTITLKNGKITSTVARMLVQNYANLTLDNMVLDGENLAAKNGNGNDYVAYTLSNCDGNTVITGGSVIKARVLDGQKSFAFDTYYKAGTYEDATVTVDGATIYGDVELAGGSLTLTAGTLNGALVEGDNIEKGVVTKDDAFEADAPEGYIWGANGVLTAIALPTATVEEITAEGLQAAAKYTLTDKGAGYDDWNGDFIVTFDQDIAAGAVTLKGNYGTYGWVELSGTAYTKDVGKGVMATLGKTISVAELAALDPAEFLCGITNNSVEAEVKVTVQFVITDGKTTEAIGEAFKATLPAAEPEKPQVVPEEQGTVEFKGEGENEVAVITPKQDVTEIDINPTIGFMGKYEIPATITKITGVEKSQLIIKSGEFDIAPACKLVEGAIVLDEAATVTVNEEQIPVKPVLSEATDEVKPLVVGDTTAVGVKTIPGLTYTLVRSTVLGGETTDVASQMAEGARLQLTDEFVGGKPASAFYVIQVTK